MGWCVVAGDGSGLFDDDDTVVFAIAGFAVVDLVTVGFTVEVGLDGFSVMTVEGVVALWISVVVRGFT